MILLRKYNFKNVLKWIKLQLQCVTMSDSNRPHLIDLNDLDSKKYIMRYKACCVILNYGKYDGLNTEDFDSFLDQFQFNLNNDIDLSIVIHMIEVCMPYDLSFQYCVKCITEYVYVCFYTFF